ncbi:MAG: succinyldiaminopimelate transaminase [Gammaproteobacteria bacterium]
MNPNLDRLPLYPFERLAALKAGVEPPSDLEHIAMSIGEPRHAPPPFVVEALRQSAHDLGRYPMAPGSNAFRAAAANWLNRRFGLIGGGVDPATMVLPVGGTREGLFAFVQAVVDSSRDPVVLMPNPFYQIYEGAALLANAKPVYMNTWEQNEYLPDLESVGPDIFRRCQLLFICSPGNPTGAVLDADFLERVIALADEFDFIIAADECYSEIYLDEDEPPTGLLEVCQQIGRVDFRRCVVFHSLSKRSSVPGLRAGFVAGDADVMKSFRLYRTYHGCAIPFHTEVAAIAALSDDDHVRQNRAMYREKFDAVLPVLEPVLKVSRPEAGFYLWLQVDDDDEVFTRELFASKNVTALPGSYLARDTESGNPGRHRVRLSLVAPVMQCVDAAERIRDFVTGS